MAKVTFKLRNGNGKTASIQLFFNYGTEKRLRYSTGLSIMNIKNWDSDKMRIKNVTAEIHKNDINNKLTDIQSFIEKLHTQFITKSKNLNNDILKKELSIFLNKEKPLDEKKSKVLELLPFFHWYLENYKVNPMVATGKPMGIGTAKTYKNAYHILKKFNDTTSHLLYKNIDLAFYDSYLNYMQTNEYSLNYIGTQIKILKTIMNASFERGFHNNLDFKKSWFKKPNEEVYNIYLNTDELQDIFDLDFSEFKPKKTDNGFILSASKLDNARDLFLISANTALRVSDFNNLTPTNIISDKGNNYISLITQKNPKGLTIPINSAVQSILNKNEGQPPKRMPEQHINYCLKEIGELAKIDEVVEKEITKGGVKIKNEFKKFELITNHTGRRSFCTNAYKSGMPTIDIMAISGHSTEKVFYGYIKVDNLERAHKISKHKFFS
jgi:integrase